MFPFGHQMATEHRQALHLLAHDILEDGEVCRTEESQFKHEVSRAQKPPKRFMLVPGPVSMLPIWSNMFKGLIFG